MELHLHTSILPSSRYSLPPPLFLSHSSPIKTSLPFSRFNSFPKLQTLTRGNGRGLRPCNYVASQEEEDKSRDVVDDDEKNKMIAVCDKLIGVFMVDKPTPTDWRKLLAFSRNWDNIRPHFFARCQDKAVSEADPVMQEKLLRLARKLKEIDEDVKRHNDLLDVIRKDPSEITNIVAKRRKDFTNEFFEHLNTVAQSYYNDAEKQNELVKLGEKCLAAVQAFDGAIENIEQINAAQLKLQDIVNSPSLDAACRKIDNLAGKKELDSTLVLMITKAWAAAKDSNMTKPEVKDILFHLYQTTVANLQRNIPKDVRIVKYLIQIEDPEEQLSALKDAFTPGVELEGPDVDSLYTTPEKLHMWVKSVVDAYHLSKEGTLLREARDMMSPEIIKKLEMLQKVIERKFM
ncbi:hypothetical protein L195_g009113 [Trifolium pratense]|uniref:Uncharacterized protein n=2 Tax=Trifolium pratense TaxID=57577 RepID=A0ACB0KQ42_TRIPR|nr:hypothetical protein L195_g009113 [Trifolium pratense]CAJ2658049.1 unnamed protein product [Trifolium pratense]